ncbi:MAG: nickel pincer cofactor biosynthesis protein LarB, partial [Nitrospirae bacterium]
RSGGFLITKATKKIYAALKIKGAKFHPASGMISVGGEKKKNGNVLVFTAGTSDISVAEEAAVTASFLGSKVETVYDVGVAGLHRLLNNKKSLHSARVIIVVAGMEGALPSVVGGLTDKPIIAVPTSVGYGTSLGGLTALFAMLNSCVPGIAVMNIDNGFGAGCLAHKINML